MDTQAVRSGDLTWAQRDWFFWVPLGAPAAFEANQNPRIPGFGAGRAHVVAAVRDLLLRHEGLRTLVTREGGALRQHVLPVDGARLAEAVVVTDEEPGGPVTAAAVRTAFDLGTRWPVLFVLHVAGERVREVGIVLDHSAVDAWGMRVLCGDLATAIRARARGREPMWRSEAEQPLDAARWEGSVAGERYRVRAEERWARTLTGLRESLGDHGPRDRGAVALSARPYHSCRLASGRLAAAATDLARTAGGSVSAAYLHAFGATICEVERSPAAGVFAFVLNRPSAGAMASVRKTIMHTPVAVPSVDAAPYGKAVAATAARQFDGHRFANLDPHVSERLCAHHLGPHHRTGVAFARFNFIDDSVVGPLANSRSLDAEGIRFQDPASHGRVTFGEAHMDGSEYLLTVQHGAAGALLTLSWREDTGWGPHAEGMLRHIERLMVWGASGAAERLPQLMNS
ncbi:hypothetical protein [Nonomuraea endophytica]|uniref:Condensation domain-containing protein n=1 Tax=Nonomuraea endophytica TaxID=714136 RepID=A0A7W8AD99_9ACTN|nr:hypothetical protein [Nonomuraea endophytica]MBB5084067.1 hypothetical protein [Nonomuraea endophytica]